MTKTLLLVDDQADMRAAIAQWFNLADFDVIETKSGHDALGHLNPDFPGVLLSDVRMPGMDGLDLLRQAQTIDRDIPVVLMTGHGDVPMAVEAMRLGAYDFLEKPFEPQSLIDVVKRAQEKRTLVLSNRTLRARLSDSSDIDRRLIGNSPVMQRLKEEILDFAQTDASVLISGETGTGKELVARSLHDFGRRTDGPFIAINCPAVPETMFEAELFGHAAGAYTGATQAREGWIEAADKGVLFLDELSSLPLHLQPKLLRVLQEREISRLGSSSIRSVDFRAIAATNADLVQASEDRTFREDLLYRLNTIEIHVPPLREREQDAILLFETFCQRFAELQGLNSCLPSPEDAAFILSCDWPGNVRQLRNVAERFTLRNQKRPVSVADVMNKPDMSQPATGPLKALVETYESQLIRQALKRHSGNMTDVMADLDLPRRTLNEKMSRYGIERSDYL
ncbi:sigma-54-dependent transcriptional regulator [Coralliovum pocilloporae]|uniref:sigma-54-dependent transcriptional regulator n=1 Tax=Coralliovum pocilloporae TaxID=3066369 RepID=UPI003306C60D